jgi:ADP-ribose pyrophosphatase
MTERLPPLPAIRLDLLEDVSPDQPPGFLRVVRRRLTATYPDGSVSRPFLYDEVDRSSIDAVVIAAYFRQGGLEPWVYLRSALRPPLVFRDPSRSPSAAIDPKGSIWELPAGLVDAGEQSLPGVRRCASRELAEELGFQVAPDKFVELGPSTFPAPGFIAERHYFFAVEVDPALAAEPGLDGSPLEKGGVVAALPVEAAIALCRDGTITDEKTELGLRRLKELLA